MLKQLTHKTYIILLGASLVLAPVSLASSDYDDDVDDLQNSRSRTQQMVDDLESFKASNTSSDGTIDYSAMQEKLQNNPSSAKMQQVLLHYQNMSPEQIKSLLIERAQGTKAQIIYEKAPMLLDFVSELLHDKNAIPNFLRDSKDFEKTKSMVGLMIGTIVIGFIIGFIIKKMNVGFFMRIWLGLFKFSLVWFLRVGVLLHFYGDGLRPMAKIFKRTMIDQILERYTI